MQLKNLFAKVVNPKPVTEFFRVFFVILSFQLLTLNLFAGEAFLLSGNDQSLNVRSHLLMNAKKEINVAYYILGNDSVAKQFLILLREAALKGVDVKLIIDYHGKQIDSLFLYKVLHDDTGKIIKNFKIKIYNPPELYTAVLATYRMHDKIFLVDDEYLISGGRNIANGFFGYNYTDETGKKAAVYEDLDILITQSSAIQQSKDYFQDLWNSSFVIDYLSYSRSFFNLDICTKMLVLNSTCRKIKNLNSHTYSQSDFEKIKMFNLMHIQDFKKDYNYAMANTNPIKDVEYFYDRVETQSFIFSKSVMSTSFQLYSQIVNAKKSVTIIAPYFVITPEQELIFAILKMKGIPVTVITNSEASNDVLAAQVGYEKSKNTAKKHNLILREFNGPETLHTKMVVIDGEKYFIGSYNWDYRSQNINREVGIYFDLNDPSSQSLGRDLTHYVDTLLGKSHQYEYPFKEESSLAKIEDLFDTIVNKNYNRLFWETFYPLLKHQL